VLISLCEISDLISKKKIEKAKLILREKIKSEEEFDEEEIMGVFSEIFSNVEIRTENDFYLLHLYAEKLFSAKDYENSLKHYTALLDYGENEELLIKVWECHVQMGHVAKASDYGKKLINYLIKYKRIEKLNRFISVYGEAGGEKRIVSEALVYLAILKGDKDEFKKSLAVYPNLDGRFLDEVLYYVLQNRAYWKKFEDLEDNLLNIFNMQISLMPEERRVVQRQVLTILFKKTICGEVNEELISELLNYCEQYNDHLLYTAIKNYISCREDIPEAREISFLNTDIDNQENSSVFEDVDAVIMQINSFIDNRLFKEAKELLSEYQVIYGGGNEELERLARKLKRKEEDTINDVTLFKKNILNEIGLYSSEDNSVTNIENISLDEKKIIEYLEKRKDEYNFNEWLDLARTLDFMGYYVASSKALNDIEKHVHDMPAGKKQQYKFLVINNMLNNRLFENVIKEIEAIIKLEPLTIDEKISFLSLKRKAYKNMNKNVLASDVDKAIEKLKRESS
jgi:hypothetical protein